MPSLAESVSFDLYHYERELQKKGFSFIAGVDEAGRGPLAGPVVAAACVIPEGIEIDKINDSKQLTPAKRAEIFFQLKKHPKVDFGIGIIDAEIIDEINILQATLLAMKESIKRLSIMPNAVIVDGKQTPDVDMYKVAIVKGDAQSLSIAAASIIAKETRDALMDEYHEKWPKYGFNKHKGYGTKFHREMIEKYGPCPIHRVTFEPIKSWLNKKYSDR